MLGAVDGFQGLVAGGALGLGDEPRDDDDLRAMVQALLVDAPAHLLLHRFHLVQDVHNLRSSPHAAVRACAAIF